MFVDAGWTKNKGLALLYTKLKDCVGFIVKGRKTYQNMLYMKKKQI